MCQSEIRKASVPPGVRYESNGAWRASPLGLWGPTVVKSLNGKSYAAVRKDDTTHEVKIDFLTKKSEAFESYQQDVVSILNHGGAPI